MELVCLFPLHTAQTRPPAEGDTWRTLSSPPLADRKAETAVPGKGHHGAMALRVAAQHPGHSCASMQFEGMGNPPAVHHCLNPNLQSFETCIRTLVNVCACWHNGKAAGLYADDQVYAV